MGLLDGFKKVVGAVDSEQSLVQENSKILSQYSDRVQAINALEQPLEKLSDDELKYRLRSDTSFLMNFAFPGPRLLSFKRNFASRLEVVTKQHWTVF